jgi:hypothetical protein
VVATAILALLGGTLGVALDWVHVASGTTAYAAPAFFGLAWWVPVLFATAAVAMGLARPLAERLTDRMSTQLTTNGVLIGLGIFVLAYLVSSLLPLPSLAVAAVISILFLCTWGTSDGTALGFGLAFATALTGTAVEIGLTAAGVFRHTHRELAGVAIWLPALYATAQLSVGAIGKRLVDAPH